MNNTGLFVGCLKCVMENISNLERIDADRQKICDKLKQTYQQMESLNIENEFYEFLEQEYGDDEEIYLMFLRYMYEMTGFIRPHVEYLKRKLKQEFDGENDLYVELNLWSQIRSLLFCIGQKIPFAEQWDINEKIAANMMKVFPFTFEKIKKSDRDKDLVVLVVQVILSDKHAPTKLALEIARTIQKHLKKRVLIVSAVLILDADLLIQRGIAGYFHSVNTAERRGLFQIIYRDVQIDTYQIALEKKNDSEIRQLIDELYGVRPFCVWNLAAEPSLSAVAKQWTTSIYTLMCQGYPPVNADCIVNYIPAYSREDRENKEFLLKHNIKVSETEFLFPYEKPQKNLQREDFGIPGKGVFCLGIVGTRLLSECTDEFLEVLNRVLDKEKQIFVLFLGFSSEDMAEFKKKLRKAVPNLSDYKLMEYKEDLIEYLKFMDLFINPPRIGGGNCGAMAMSLGIPVVTLKTGDIAAVAGERYTVDTLEQYADLILKYKNNPEFLKEQSDYAMKRISEQTMDEFEFASVIQNIFDTIA